MGPIFVGREKELQQLGNRLELMIGGQGQTCFVTGEAGFAKTSLATEFARRAQRARSDLLVVIGDCNAHTGIGDPYLPFRELLSMLLGDTEERVAQGMTTKENAGRLEGFLGVSKRVLADLGPDLASALAVSVKTYCLYEASSADEIREAARRNGVPADVIVEVGELSALGAMGRVQPQRFSD